MFVEEETKAVSFQAMQTRFLLLGVVFGGNCYLTSRTRWWSHSESISSIAFTYAWCWDGLKSFAEHVRLWGRLWECHWAWNWKNDTRGNSNIFEIKQWSRVDYPVMFQGKLVKVLCREVELARMKDNFDFRSGKAKEWARGQVHAMELLNFTNTYNCIRQVVMISGEK